MSQEPADTRGGLSRRAFTGLGLAAGATAAAVAALPGVPALAGPPTVTPVAAGALQPDALGAANPALTYLTLDAFAFFNDSTIITPLNPAGQRVYQDATGVQPLAPNDRLSASLPIPSGSSIFQLNVAYQQQPIVEIWKRSMVTPVPYAPVFQQSVPMGSGPSTATFNFAPPIFVEPATTVAVRFFATAGSSVLGVTVGYTPPSQSFIAFTGPTPRVLDTRVTGGPLAAGEERTIALGFPGARGAVINLTVTETEGTGGFVAVFPANIAWPGNSSINWFGANQNLANGVVAALDPSGQIKIRGGVAPTQVIIDRIGWLI
jgi:hypothetical protein